MRSRALGRTDEALDAYRQAATLAPAPDAADRDAEAVANQSLTTFLSDLQTRIGNVYLLQRNISGAEASFKRALSYDPQHALAYVGLGRMYLAQASQRLRQAGVTGIPAEPVAEDANYFNAVDAFQSALLFDPDNIQAQVGLGDLYLGYGQLDAAVGSYQEALRRDPSLSAVRDKMYGAYLAQDQGDEAVGFYQGLLEPVALTMSTRWPRWPMHWSPAGGPAEAIDAIDLFLCAQPRQLRCADDVGRPVGRPLSRRCLTPPASRPASTAARRLSRPSPPTTGPRGSIRRRPRR